MNMDEYENEFFEVAKRMGYEIETCQKGPFQGKRQIDFGHKKLHAGHLKKLYPLVIENKGYISYDEFGELIPGRPCAVEPFNRINRKIFK